MILDPDDLVGLSFYCNLEPKTEFGGTKVTGTKIDHKSIEPLAEEEEPDIEAPDFSQIAEEA